MLCWAGFNGCNSLKSSNPYSNLYEKRERETKPKQMILSSIHCKCHIALDLMQAFPKHFRIQGDEEREGRWNERASGSSSTVLHQKKTLLLNKTWDYPWFVRRHCCTSFNFTKIRYYLLSCSFLGSDLFFSLHHAHSPSTKVAQDLHTANEIQTKRGVLCLVAFNWSIITVNRKMTWLKVGKMSNG